MYDANNPTPTRLTSQEAFEIPECGNRFWKVNVDGVPRYPFEKPYDGDFIFPCATVLCASGDGMSEFRGCKQLAIGEMVEIEDRLYEVTRVWMDRYNAELTPKNDEALILKNEVDRRIAEQRAEFKALGL